MNSETVVMCVVALILGMLLAHMLKSVCGCGDVVEGGLEAPHPTDEQIVEARKIDLDYRWICATNHDRIDGEPAPLIEFTEEFINLGGRTLTCN